MRTFIAVALLIAGAIALPPPSPTPRKISHHKQNSRGQEKQQADSDSQQPQQPITPTPTHLTASPPSQNQSYDSAPTKNEKSATDWWLTVFTGALVVVAFLQVVVAIFQFCAMKKQSKYMLHQTSFMRRGLSLSRKSANAAENSANASQRAHEMMQLERRAWVGVTAAKMTNFHPGQQVRAMIWVRNSGNTFALKTTIYQRIISMPVALTQFEDMGSNEPGITLLPGADFGAMVGGGETPLPLSEFEAIKTGKMFVYMYCCVRYRDVFENSHFTQFAARYNPHTDAFDAYPGYNDAD